MISASTRRIGVISGTYRKLDQKVFDLFAGVMRIIHAGAIGDEELIWQLEKIAPVIAVRGMKDANTMCFPNERLAVIEGRTFYIRHQFATCEQMSIAQQRIIEQRMPDAVIFGQNHQAYVGRWRGTLLFNPGSAGPEHFKYPRTVGLLELRDDEVAPHILNLDDNS